MIVTLGVRLVQLLFAAVTLGLSAYLVGSYGPGKAHSLLGYGSFCGGAGLIIGVIGVIALFFDFLQGIIMLALDAFAAFFLVAGGIAFAVKIQVGSCLDGKYVTRGVGIFTPSLMKDFDTTNADKWEQRFGEDTITRCRIVQADTAFIWFLFATFLATIILAFFNRSGKRGGAIV